jgi:hypothetical protein
MPDSVSLLRAPAFICPSALPISALEPGFVCLLGSYVFWTCRLEGSKVERILVIAEFAAFVGGRLPLASSQHDYNGGIGFGECCYSTEGQTDQSLIHRGRTMGCIRAKLTASDRWNSRPRTPANCGRLERDGRKSGGSWHMAPGFAERRCRQSEPFVPRINVGEVE